MLIKSTLCAQAVYQNLFSPFRRPYLPFITSMEDRAEKRFKPRDAGMELIYAGSQVSESVETAIQEDANVVALSTLSGNHMILVPEMIKNISLKNIDIRKYPC